MDEPRALLELDEVRGELLCVNDLPQFVQILDLRGVRPSKVRKANLYESSTWERWGAPPSGVWKAKRQRAITFRVSHNLTHVL